MSPELATRTTDPDTDRPTQPLPRRRPGASIDPDVERLVAELAIAEKWPTAEGYCARCGLAPCHARSDATAVTEDDGTCNRDLTEPLTLESWLNITAARALMAVDLYGVRADRSLVAALAKRIGAFAA